MARRLFEREQVFILALNMSIFAVLGVVFIAAYKRDDAYLRAPFYLFWRFFFEDSIYILGVFGLILLLLVISSILLYRRTNVIDFSLSTFALGLTGLFILILSLNTLNLGLEVLLYPLTAHFIPPLKVHNPLIGFIAFALIFLKGFLLERVSFRGFSTVERLCLIFGFGFGFTSFQVAMLSYLKLLYPMTLTSLDLFIFMVLLLIYLSKIGPFHTSSLPSGLSVDALKSFFSKFRKVKTWEGVMLLAMAFLLFADSYYSIAAVVEWDSLAYLAYYARIIYANHGVLDLYGPSVGLEMSTAYPIGFQVLGVYLYEYVGMVDDFYMRILPPLFYFALLLAVHLLSSQIFNERKERFLCVFTVASSLILNYYVALSSHYMTYLTFLSTMALYFLLKYLKAHDQKILLLSGLFGGFASLVSYLGLVTIVFLCLGILMSKAKHVTLFFKALLINVLIPSTYLLRNWVLRRDPLYPFLTSSSDPLWVFRQQHFYFQSIYTGLQFSSPFSIVDFLVMRYLGARPWLTVCILIAPIFIAYAWRVERLKALGIEERALIAFFVTALACFLIAPMFERYILPLVALYACFYVWIWKKTKDLAMKRFALALILILIYSFSITFGASLGGYKLFKPEVRSGDTVGYLAYYYGGDADCWQWINDHADPNDKIASFEIRYYYIEREIFPLDSQEASPLYNSNLTIDEAVRYLKDHGVKYVLSPTWVSMASILPAYRRLIITPFLGEPQYFPAVYVKGSSAIYHIGPVDTESLTASYIDKGVIPPLLGLNLELDVTLKNGSSVFYLEVPGDYNQRANLTVQVLSNLLNVSIEIWGGALKNTGDQSRVFKVAAEPQNGGTINPKLNWLLQGGSYTLVVRSFDVYSNPARIRLSIAISKVQPST